MKKISLWQRLAACLLTICLLAMSLPQLALAEATASISVNDTTKTVTISGYTTVANLIAALAEKVAAGEDYSTYTTVKISGLTTATKSEGTTVAELWGKYFAAMTTLDLTDTTIPGLDFDFMSGSTTVEKVYLPSTIRICIAGYSKTVQN